MAEIRSAIIPTDRTTYTDAPLIWSELAANEQDSYSGGQYTTLESWETAKQADLVTAQEQHTAVVFNTGTEPLKTALVIDGYSTDIDNFLKITAYFEHRATPGIKDYSKATLSPVTNDTINNKGSYTQIELLNFSAKTSTTYTNYMINLSGYGIYYSTVKYCNFFNDGSSTIYRYISNEHFRGEISNNCFIDPINIGTYATITCDLLSYTSDTGGIIKNNLLNVGDRVGIAINLSNVDASITLQNNISISTTGTCYDIIITDGALIADHNVSSDTTAPGTNTVQSFDHSTLFPNAASGDFRPAISYVSALGTTWGAGAIPWERDVLVDTSGVNGDYSTLAAAEAGEQTIGDDLVLRNEKMTISCTSGGTSTADTTAVTIDADWITSLVNNFTVTAHEDDRHNGRWDDNKYNLNGIVGSTIEVASPVFLLDGLQIITTGTNADVRGIYCGTDIDFTYKNLLMLSTNTGTGNSNTLTIGTIHSINNIIKGFLDSGETIAGASYEGTGNTLVNNTSGLTITSGSCVLLNSLLSNTTDLTGTLTDDFCIASDATAVGTDSITDVTVYDAAVDTLPVVPENCVIFKDILNNDFRLVSHKVENYKGEMVETNVAIGNGKYIYDVKDDCAGKSRQPYQFKGARTQRTFDIGAWQAPVQLEYVVDTDGVHGDYSSLYNAFEGLKADTGDLVTDNMLPTISCQASTGVADTGGYIDLISLSSEDCFLTLYQSRSIVFDSGAYVLKMPSGTYIIHAPADNTIIDGLHVEQLQAAGGYSAAMYVSGSDSIVRNCMLKCSSDTTNLNGVTLASKCTFTDNIIFSPIQLDGSLVKTSAYYTTIRNNTLYGLSEYGLYKGWSTLYLEANIVVGTFLDAYVNAGGDTIGVNNISSDLTGDITGLSSTYFTDLINGDFTPVASAGDLTSYSASANSTTTVGAIPFVYEKTVGTGKDYTDMTSWLAGASSSTVTGEITKAVCFDTETSSIDIAGLDTIVEIANITVVPSVSGTNGITISIPDVTIINPLVYRDINKLSGIGIEDNSDQAIILNATIDGFLTGIDGSRTKVNNSICTDNTTDFSVAIDNYNIASDVSTTGFNSLTNQVATDLFVDPVGGDFRLKAGSAAIGAGIDLSDQFTTDIAGETRTVPWDIGAFSFIELGGDVVLVTADGSHLQTAESLALFQAQILALSSAGHDHSADNLTLIQQHVIALADSAQAHLADSLVLQQIHNLDVSGGNHAHTATNLALLQQHIIELAGGKHTHTADSLALLQQHFLDVLDSAHAQFADQITFLQGQILDILGASHAHTAGDLLLLQQHFLELMSASHTQVADSLQIIQQQLLAMSDANHSQQADSLQIIQQHLVAIAEAHHDHTSSDIVLQQIHELAIADTSHELQSSNITLLVATLVLAIASALQEQAADSLTLQQAHLITIAEAYHNHISESCNVTTALLLAIANALQSQSAGSLTLTQEHMLEADNAVHTLFSDTLGLSQIHQLNVEDAIQALFSENVDLLQEHNISIDGSLHLQASDNIVLFLQGMGLGVITDAGIIRLTPERRGLTITVERSAKHV